MSKKRFNYLPDLGAKLSVVGNVTALNYGDNYEQRIATSINKSYRKQQCTFARPLDEANAIYDFLIENGYVDGFEWKDPRGQTGVWAVDAESLSMTQSKPGIFQITATFVEKFES